jgi:hypothetical protein
LVPVIRHPSPYGGQIRAGVRLAHADCEKLLGAGDRGQVALPLILGAVLQDRRRHLAVGDPVGRHRGAVGEEFLGDDEALHGRAPLAAVLLGKGHADPAAVGKAAAETDVDAGHPGVGAGHEAAGFDLLIQKPAYLLAQRA